MKTLTTILLTLLVLGGCSKEVTIDKLVERIGSDGERLAYEVNSSTPFTGTSIRIHRGEIDRRVTYKNGLKDGLLEEICRSGQISQKAMFQKGKRHGITKWLDCSTGAITSQNHYVNGDKDFFVDYHPNCNNCISEKGYWEGHQRWIVEKYDREGNPIEVKLQNCKDKGFTDCIVVNVEKTDSIDLSEFEYLFDNKE